MARRGRKGRGGGAKAKQPGSSLTRALVKLVFLALIVGAGYCVTWARGGGGNAVLTEAVVSTEAAAAAVDSVSCETDGTCPAMSSNEVAALRAHYANNITNVDLSHVFLQSGARATLDVGAGADNGEAALTPADLMESIPYANFLLDEPFYGEERPMGAKFRSFWRRELEMRWDDGTEEGTYSGVIEAMGFTATNTYTTHTFIFFDRTLPRGEQEVVRYEMEDDSHLYIIDPEPSDARARSSDDYAEVKREQTYMRKYYAEHGKPWLQHYPRALPVLNMWPATRVGQTHAVTSRRSFFRCDPNEPSNSLETCRDTAPVSIELKAVSTAPRVFVVEDLLSEFECEYVKKLGQKIITRSTVGTAKNGFESQTRTSQTAWIKRSHSSVIDQIFARAADVLGVHNEIMQHDTNAEHLQVVRYVKNQQYMPHHDFGYSKGHGQRILTLLLYIDIPEEGGGTSFPKAYGGRGLEVRPPKGSGVLFYSMTGDGNADDDSLHSGMKVLKGKKWICNMVRARVGLHPLLPLGGPLLSAPPCLHTYTSPPPPPSLSLSLSLSLSQWVWDPKLKDTLPV